MKVLEDKGYKCWKTDNESYGVVKHYQRRLQEDEILKFSIPLCQCNDKTLLNVVHSDLLIHGHKSESFEVSLCHENKDGEWCDLKIYSLTRKQVEDSLDRLEQKVLNMWKAFND